MTGKLFSAAAGFLAAAAFVYTAASVDLSLRARKAYFEGEKYYRWHLNPSEKSAFYLNEYGKKKKILEGALSSGKTTREQYLEELEAAGLERATGVEDSSIKQACVWYKTAAGLFAPPESKWAVLSREKLAAAKEMWKKELTEKGVPFRDYMLE